MSIRWKQYVVEVNGIKVFYTRTGGNKPVLIMNHGATDNGLCWKPVAEQLQDRYDILMPDARGHGRSGSGHGQYGVVKRAQDLIALIKGLQLDRPILMGHSMGAQTTLFTAAMYPENVRAAILEDPILIMKDETIFQQVKTEETGRMLAESARKNKKTPRLALRSYAKKNFGWNANEIRHWITAKKQMSNDFIHSLEVIKDEPDPWDALAGIIAPVLLITGLRSKGGIVSDWGAEEAKSIHGQLTVAHFDTGHNIRREDFEGYMAAVKVFLGTV
ncbi:MAG: alpha/beta hydrolase [Anaerolineae bacterium]|jgi:pimeloyl-ACP methyl ester carboxylesterase|nr:alpha/beta hydrolase [Anaerolineae bacterium]